MKDPGLDDDDANLSESNQVSNFCIIKTPLQNTFNLLITNFHKLPRRREVLEQIIQSGAKKKIIFLFVEPHSKLWETYQFIKSEKCLVCRNEHNIECA